MNDCLIEECKYNHTISRRRGMCDRHYRIWIKNNATTTLKQRRESRPAIIEGTIAKIPLGVNAKDGYAIIDAENAKITNKYKFNKVVGTGYVRSTDYNYLHHIIMGKPNDGRLIDHINMNKLDNRKSNLRIISSSLNIHNRGIKSNNTLGYKGIVKCGENRWAARLIVNGNLINGGKVFKSKEEAAIRYNELAIKHIGEYANLNKVKL